MRNLFFKVFALILFSALAAFTAATVFFALAYDHDELFEEDYREVTELAHEVIEDWREHGDAGLARESGALRRHGIRMFLMRADGAAIGRAPPQTLREQLTEYPQSVRIESESPRGALLARAVRVTDAGEQFTFVLTTRERARIRPNFFGGGARILWPLAVIAFASLLISVLITRPLGGLKTAAQKFAGGNLQARAPAQLIKRNDAFGELAREFNRMSARIETLVGGQRQLLRDVSHELRSPLSRMQVAASLLEAGGDAHAHIERIQLEITRLDELIAQLLSLARLQAGAPLQMRTINLCELLRSVARDASYEFAGRGKDINVHAGARIDIRADTATLQSALENIMRNALRYAKAKVEVHARAENAHVEVRIADDGPGVAHTELRKIFDAFHRPDSARSAGSGGAGIGLAIAKSAVHAHRGTVRAQNADRGGLVVTLRLPR